MGLSLGLDLGSAQPAAAAGAAAATLTFEWKVTGGSEAAILPDGTAMPGNMAGKQLILVITSADAPSTLDSAASGDTGCLNPDGDYDDTELPADTPVEVAFDMTAGVLAGIVPITLTIDGTPYIFTFHCFQIAGALRAVNSGATATTGVVVNGVTIGDAATGHASLSAAHAAATAGDTVVATEAFADSTGFTMTKSLTVDVVDGSRHDGTVTANGYRITGQIAGTPTAAIFRNVRFSSTSGSQTSFLLNNKTGGSNATFDRCVFVKTGTFQALATLGDGSGTAALTVRNTILYTHTSANGIVLNAIGGNTSVVCENVTIFGIDAATDSVNGFWNNGGAGGGSFTVKNCIALGVFSGAGFAGGTPGFAAGSARNVGNTSTTPPGTDPATTTAAAYFKNVTGGSEDAHCVSRAVLDDFTGTDLSANFTKDIDGAIRSDWFAGADWIAA